jgi:1-aminocyclopropane-1-carboxylate deaminase
LHEKFGDFYPIPEGGTNDLAVRGTSEYGEKLLATSFDFLFLPVGTGGTMAGIVGAFANKRNVIGVSVLKDGQFLTTDVEGLVKKNFNASYGNWSVLTSYHHGGYAKVTEPLLAFLVEMQKTHNLPLDPVYTGKLLWAVREEVIKGRFSRGVTILALHTGGLQGASTLMTR